MQSHISFCKGFKKEIFYNKTNLITQNIYFISKQFHMGEELIGLNSSEFKNLTSGIDIQK